MHRIMCLASITAQLDERIPQPDPIGRGQHHHQLEASAVREAPCQVERPPVEREPRQQEVRVGLVGASYMRLGELFHVESVRRPVRQLCTRDVHTLSGQASASGQWCSATRSPPLRPGRPGRTWTASTRSGQVGDRKRLQADFNCMRLRTRTFPCTRRRRFSDRPAKRIHVRGRVNLRRHGAGAGPVVRAAKGVRLCVPAFAGVSRSIASTTASGSCSHPARSATLFEASAWSGGITDGRSEGERAFQR